MDTIPQLGRQQLEAVELVKQWFDGPDQWFYLGGWAGTGKTSLAYRLAEELVGLSKTIFAAYTGKAAYVLRTKGCLAASTMHSYLYTSKESSRAKLKQLQEELQLLESELHQEGAPEGYLDAHPGVQLLQGKIFQEEKELRRPRFVLNQDSALQDCGLSVIDEASMCNTTMGDDWLSFKQKTLVLGDPFQLPPVGGEGYFTKNMPNFMLTDIHRQAASNPIIQLASMVRRMEMPEPGWYGSSRVVRKRDLSPEDLRKVVLESDQLIVGKNETRHQYNNRIRMLRGFKQRHPMAGETVVCLRNNHELGLLNGALYNVVEQIEVFDNVDRIDLLIQPVTGGDQIEVHSHTHHFLGKEDQLQKAWFERKDAEEFDYGYALTCHKVQGSQFKNPVIFDQSHIARDHRWNWLYTAVTRAEEKLTLVLP